MLEILPLQTCMLPTQSYDMQDMSLGPEKLYLIALLRKHGVVLKGGDSRSGARLVDDLLVRLQCSMSC